MPLPGLALPGGGTGKPTSLAEWAAQSLANGSASGLSINVDGDSMNDVMESFRVSDDGTLQLLSESCSNYNINAEGLSQVSTPGGPGSNPTWDPASPSTPNRYFNCKGSEIRKLKLLGHGGCGTVFKAVHEGTRTLLALKEINAMDKTSRDQMLNEVRTLCALPELEGLVKFHGAFYTQEEGRISIALEYMNGGSLEDIAKAVPDHSIPEPILSAICGKILVGLQYLHSQRSLVHRDIKPANLLLNLQGQPKITDFGISSCLALRSQCSTNVGTFTYMSPERLENSPYSFASDIWSIGLSILELATGRYPYTNTAPVPFILEVTQGEVPLPPAGMYSPELIEFISLCMERDPADRPTALALLHHPWIQMHRGAIAHLEQYVSSVVPHAQQRQAEDAAIQAAAPLTPASTSSAMAT